ncbi:hypothetical protein KSP40_PGU005792 [Platanthera guangdongensis]|uniref:Protein NEDD1 n=1 Tax=Platanthera guangdongensis TaxID=2320717 RepID=A0ABR2MFW4_9ASPA
MALCQTTGRRWWKMKRSAVAVLVCCRRVRRSRNGVDVDSPYLVVASAGEDKKISLWRKNGQSMGTIPLTGTNIGDDIEESIVSITFSNKSSRYVCSGGSGRVVRIWDLQRKRCIKWLSGHTDTITGVMYNCKDEHLASISMKGDLILHNLASGARAADFKDPFGQVLRVLEYSRLSRHILVIAGDDGSIHLWDTTGRAPKFSCVFTPPNNRNCPAFPPNSTPTEASLEKYNTAACTSFTAYPPFSLPKTELSMPRFAPVDTPHCHLIPGRTPVSWLKQHSAPTTGVCLSPSSDKIIASAGLDKKLYTFDSAMKRPTSCVPYDTPFSSLTYSDDGNVLAAGTSGGLVVFYDVRGKPQPFTILHAFNSSERSILENWINSGKSEGRKLQILASINYPRSTPENHVISSSDRQRLEVNQRLEPGGKEKNQSPSRPGDEKCRPAAAGEESCWEEIGKSGSVALGEKENAVTSLCWQRAKPFIVNENSCTAETALLGGASEDSVLMPDPRPSLAASSFSSTNTVSSSSSSSISSSSGSISTTFLSTAEETLIRSSLWRGGTLSKLQAPRGNFNLKDDMDVFSPLVDVQPITPSLGSLWDDHDDEKKDSLLLDKKSLAFPSTSRKFPFTDGDTDSHRILDWRSNTASKQVNPTSWDKTVNDDESDLWIHPNGTIVDDILSSSLTSTPAASSKSESSFSPTPPEAWGGNALAGKSSSNYQLPPTSLVAGLTVSVPQDLSSLTSQFSKASMTNLSSSSLIMQNKSLMNNEKLPSYSESSSAFHSATVSSTFGIRPMTSTNWEQPGSVPSILPRRYTSYVDRLNNASSFSDGISSATSSPKSKKTGAETREELLNNLMSRHDVPIAAAANGNFPMINACAYEHDTLILLTDIRVTGSISSSSKGLLRSTSGSAGKFFVLFSASSAHLEETLGSLHKSIHDDVKNLHIDLLRQFHMQEVAMSNLLSSVLEKQDELIKEVQTLRRENQQLRQLL